MYKDPHIEIHREREKRNYVSFVAIGMRLKTGEDDTHTLEWRGREEGDGGERRECEGEGEGEVKGKRGRREGENEGGGRERGGE